MVCPDLKEGYHYIQWIHTVFGDCIYTPREQASFWVGIASIGFWIVAQVPQIIQNFVIGDASSLSPLFLLIWAVGDSANLIGALLTGQLATQILQAIYFFACDCILWGQWIFYFFRNRRRKTQEKKPVVSGSTVQPKKTVLSILFPFLLTTTLIMGTATFSQSKSSASWDGDSLVTSKGLGRQLFGVMDDSEPKYWPPTGYEQITGYAIGCFSAFMYLTSRIPQIIKNYQRKSTEGLSPLLFFCAVMGNGTYTLSVLLFSLDKYYLYSRLPWIIGSAGVLVLDFTVLSQFILFKYITKTEQDPNAEKYGSLNEEEAQETVQDGETPVSESPDSYYQNKGAFSKN